MSRARASSDPLLAPDVPSLPPITLLPGDHDSFEDGACLMELVAHLAGEEHSDRPECACDVIATAARGLNDAIDCDTRRTAMLANLAPLIVGTRCTFEQERDRSYQWFDWLVRVHAPAFLELTSALSGHAEALRSAPRVLAVNRYQLEEPVHAAFAAAIRGGLPLDTESVEAAHQSVRDAIGEASFDAASTATQDLRLFDIGWNASEAAKDAARAAISGGVDLNPTVHRLQQSAADLIRKQCEEHHAAKAQPTTEGAR